MRLELKKNYLLAIALKNYWNEILLLEPSKDRLLALNKVARMFFQAEKRLGTRFMWERPEVMTMKKYVATNEELYEVEQ